MVKKSFAVPLLGSKEGVCVSASLFGVHASPALLAQYMRIYTANQKPSTALSQTRSFVTASRRKIYRQKGTGNARHGDVKAPIFVGGGTAHGPKNTKRILQMPKKMRRKALFYSLSLKLLAEKIRALSDKFFAGVEKTKDAYGVLEKNNKGTFEFRRLLVVLPHGSAVKQLLRNVEGVEACEACDLNAFEVTRARAVLFTEQSLQELHTLFGFKNNE